jgi:hypothetical protein
VAEQARVLAPRVFILSSPSLFAEALSGLLERNGYAVIGIRPYDEGMPAFIGAAQPDVVILDVRAVPPSATATLLDCARNIRVVCVSLDSQSIGLYEHRESAATVQEFLELMASGGNRRPE